MQLLLSHSIFGKLISALSWTLIHSLWQGLLLGLIALLLLQLTGRSTASRRYNGLLFLFYLSLLTSFITFIWQLNGVADGKTNPIHPFFPEAFLPTIFSGPFQNIITVFKTGSNYLLAREQFIFFCWLIVFMYKLLKLTGAMFYQYRIRRKEIYDPSAALQQTCLTLCKKLRLTRTVRLMESGFCKVPVVLGYIKPLILLPAGLLSNLPMDQVEAILLHELAHIRRNDYLVNLLQHLAEAIFFFNPCMIWLSARLREERENCCDDIAIEYMQNRKSLVAALVSFKEYELYGNTFAIAFPGRKNFLMQRVKRILDRKNNGPGIEDKLFLVPGIILLLAIFIITSFQPQRHVEGKQARAIGNSRPSPSQNIIAQSENTKRSTNHGITDNTTAPINETMLTKAEAKEAIESYIERAEAAKELAEMDQMETTHTQQAMEDDMQAQKDQKQAIADQQQALKDMLAADKDQQEASRSQQKAKLEYEQMATNKSSLLSDETKAEQLKALKKAAEKAASNKTNN